MCIGSYTKKPEHGSKAKQQVVQGSSNRFRIHLNNGTTYVFSSSGGDRYTINDSFGGSWPVTFVDHGNTGVFRFASYKLVATQNNGSLQPAALDRGRHRSGNRCVASEPVQLIVRVL